MIEVWWRPCVAKNNASPSFQGSLLRTWWCTAAGEYQPCNAPCCDTSPLTPAPPVSPSDYNTHWIITPTVENKNKCTGFKYTPDYDHNTGCNPDSLTCWSLLLVSRGSMLFHAPLHLQPLLPSPPCCQHVRSLELLFQRRLHAWTRAVHGCLPLRR